MNNFAGQWQTTFGPMKLTQTGTKVGGVYFCMSAECPIAGKIANGRLVFTYQEPTVHGEGWFELARNGKAFAGQFRPDGAANWEPWEGERIGFDGLWNTSFGLMRLSEDGDEVNGFYEVGGNSTITGRRTGNGLTFTYREPKTRGRGRFELAADGLSFQGEWRARSEPNWRPWTGTRVLPRRNLTWLVVIEAPWQRFLSDQEYSFGNMLREFFARVEGVQVRHRFFTNEAGLRKCCRDLQYIAEPVVLVVATHGEPAGITVDGQVIGLDTFVEYLRCAGSLKLLHFSACLLMQGAEGVRALTQFSERMQVPISGYKTSVNWAASAIIEFTYLDMILSQGRTPADAATQLARLLPFSTNEGVCDGAYPAAGFSILMPGPTKSASNGAVARRRTKAPKSDVGLI